MTQAHETREHSELSASGAYRWMACPGSVQLCRTVPPKPPSSYALEGTAAHELAEKCLADNIDATDCVGMPWRHIEELDAEFCDAVQVYINLVRELLAKSPSFIAMEGRFSLARLKPPAPMFGTTDFACIIDDVLYVLDFKFGKGVLVEVVDNPQLLYYALGALMFLPAGVASKVRSIDVTIVQPRASHIDGPIRAHRYTLDEVIDFTEELFRLANIAIGDNPPFKAGPQCRWCDAHGICAVANEQALTIAREEFGIIDERSVPVEPPHPALINPDALGQLMAKFRVLEEWMKAVREHSFRIMEAGVPVPGWKLVAKRGVRKWKNEQSVKDWAFLAGYNPDDLYSKELKSPAQVEHMVGKKHLSADLYEVISSGLTLTEASDKRPAASSLAAADEFSAIE